MLHGAAEGNRRGNVNVRVGGNDYSVDVLTAVKNDGREVAYDVVNIQPTTIKASDEKTSEAFGGSRRTIADLAEGGNRGLPGSPLSAEAKTTTQESAGSSSAQNPDTNIAPGGQEVKGKTAESYADVTLKANAGELDSESWNRTEQLDAARQLVRDARMSTKGVQTVVNNMPQGVGAEIYAPAAASLYRLGVVEDVSTFEDALRLTGKGGMSARVQQVLALGKTGETALKIAYLQGKGEGGAKPDRAAAPGLAGHLLCAPDRGRRKLPCGAGGRRHEKSRRRGDVGGGEQISDRRGLCR